MPSMVLPDGRLLISTLGNVSVTGASGADEDLLVFTPAALGSTTSGTWAMYFDGSTLASPARRTRTSTASGWTWLARST